MLNDITKFDEQAEDAYQTIADQIILPTWMTFPVPTTPVYTVKQTGKTFIIVETKEKFNDITTAYDHVQNNLKGDVVFEDLAKDDANPYTGIYFVPPAEGANSSRMLISHTDRDSLALIKYHYYEFLKLDARYHENVEDWVKAYSWLQGHPAFYHRREEFMNDWIMDNGLKGMWVDVERDRKGNSIVSLEHGEWLNEDRTGGPCHNFKLDSYGSTFEEAYIALAKNVDTHFDVDGNSRNIDVELPDYLKVVYERLDSYNASQSGEVSESVAGN